MLQGALEKARAIIEEKNPDLPNKDEVARQVGIGAVVFTALFNNRIKDIDFWWDRALNFDGETGPYVQYTYARCSSLLRKGGYQPGPCDYSLLTDDQALALTLEHSLNLARSAFCVPDFGCRTPVLENILYLGLPMIQQAVFDGSWSRLKKEKIWRKPT